MSAARPPLPLHQLATGDRFRVAGMKKLAGRLVKKLEGCAVVRYDEATHSTEIALNTPVHREESKP